MTVIFGGAYQGKLSWAVEHFGLQEQMLCDLAEGFLPGRACYYHLEAASRRGERPDFPPEAVIISREVGSGIVPMDPEERAWREHHGSLLRQLCREADHVYRIFCGIAEVLK